MSEEVEVATLPPCDPCTEAGIDMIALYDGKTAAGPWASMCPGCFERYGIGLGTGKGQRLILRGAEPPSERVTLLAGGDTIFVYDVGNPGIDDMEAVLDVAYPGTEVERRTILLSSWEAIRDELVSHGADIVDVRKGGTNG